jgi:Protein of unknown function (DUF4235)
MSKSAAIAYKPLGLVVSVGSGLVASQLTKQIWKQIADEDEAPQATDADRGWREVLVAAAIQGVVFAVVKAAADRGGATAFRRFTGTWPGRS